MFRFNPDYSSRFRILKGGKISLVVSALLGSVSLAFAAPSGSNVVSGNVSISQSGNTTNITQSTHKSIINWQDFSIGSNETVNFNMPSSTSSSLNRVVGNNPSNIYGQLNSNGQVFLVNQNGVYFGANSQVNTAGFVASTQNITDENFLNGNYVFEGNSDASIINLGTITTDNAYTALLAKKVENEGVIKAHLGQVHLASGEKFTLDINGNSLVKLTIDKGTLDGLVANKGAIIADGGEIYLTTSALDSVLNGLVNNTGLIQANKIEEKDGKIILFAHGGTGEFGGSIEASGGFVETSGDKVKINDDFRVKANKWLIDPNDFTIAASGGNMNAATLSANLASASVEIETATMGTAGSGHIYVYEDIVWSNNTKLTLNAENNIYVNAKIENTNTTGGGVFFDAVNNHSAVQFDSNGKVVIHNVEQLQWMNTAVQGTYELGSNIDASVTRNWRLDQFAKGFTPVGGNSVSLDKFTGSFDGKGHAIDGFYMENWQYAGLFNTVGEGAVIQNISLTNVDVKGSQGAGGLAGYLDGGATSGTRPQISNIYVSGSVTGTLTHTGGLIGYVRNHAEISNSYSTATVSGVSHVGGLVGTLLANATITNSYATGKVTGTTNSGGLVGQNGAVSPFSNIVDSYWDIDSTGQASSAGGAGIYSQTSSVNAYTQVTYSGFDFTNTWFMVEGATRPFLRMEYSTNITNAHQLQLMAMNLSADYTLANNIDLAPSLTNQSEMWKGTLAGSNFQSSWFAVGNNTTQFTGNFDGLGNTVSNLYVTGGDLLGLFGYTLGANIENLTLDGVNIDSTGGWLGGLAGRADDTSIRNVSVTGMSEISSTLTGDVRAGGLVGLLLGNSSLETVSSSATVTAADGNRVGGLIGESVNTSGTVAISNSSASGNVTAQDLVGGLIGYVNLGSHVTDSSYSNGTVTGRSSVGGAIGYAQTGAIMNRLQVVDTTVTASDSTSNGLGYSDAGGVVGSMYASTLTNSLSTANVSGTGRNIGGLVGYAGTTSNIERSYATGDVSMTGNGTQGAVGGLVGATVGTNSSNRVQIKDSYATGDVSVPTGGNSAGTRLGVGGLVGYAANTSLWNTYTTGHIDGQTAGNTDGVIGVTGAGVGFSGRNLYDRTVNPDMVDTLNGRTTWELRYQGTYEGTSNHFGTTGAWSFAAGQTVDGFGASLPYLTGVTRAEDMPVQTTLFNGGWGGLTDGEQVGADGSAYSITNAHQLQNINLVATKGYDFVLSNNIDLNGVAWAPIGNDEESFTGSFNGQNFTISNLTINHPGDWYAGLFGALYEANISNLQLSNVDITASRYIGALTASAYNSTITNVSATGSLIGEHYVGGLVGSMYGGSISNSDSSVAVLMTSTGGVLNEGAFNMGGLVGWASGDASILRSYATGNVTVGDGTCSWGFCNPMNIGGLVGYANGAKVEQSYATGNVTAGNNAKLVGGLLGQFYGDGADETDTNKIINSYAIGNVNVGDHSIYIGGLIGGEEYGYVANTYSTGAVNAGAGSTLVGGLIGASDGLVVNSYWDTTTSGKNISAGGTGKTTEDLKKIATFSGWSIVGDNTIYPNYPTLRMSDSGAIWTIGTKVATPTPTPTPEPTPERTQQQEIQTIVDNVVNSVINNIIHIPTLTTNFNIGQSFSNIVTNTSGNINMSNTIKTLIPEISNSTSSFTIVSKTDGVQSVAKVTMDELVSKANESSGNAGGVSEIRVALAPDSFVELVNGGVNLPTGVSQEFYVVEEK